MVSSLQANSSAIQLIDKFMSRQKIDIDRDRNYLADVMGECRRGLEGHPSSLRMFNTFTTRNIDRESQSLKLVIDAGGTNFRVVVMFFQGLRREILYYQRYPMPGSQGKISKEKFFNQIVDFLEPVLSRDDFQSYDSNFKGFTALKFCFSYPVEFKDGDGYVTGMTKEVDIEGLIGEPIEVNLLKTLHNRGHASIENVVILNDTTATLLSGCYEKQRSGELDQYHAFIGIVWGTGFNIAYEENRFFSKPFIVNSEAGCFDKFPMSSIDRVVDDLSQYPGFGLAEKKISGYYFGIMVKQLLMDFVKEEGAVGVFSTEFQKIILDPRVELKSENISQFLIPLKENIPKDDSRVSSEFFFKLDGEDRSQVITRQDQVHLSYFIERISGRSAYITAVMTAGLMLQSVGRGTGPIGDISWKKFCIVLDGSMINKMPGLKDKFIEYLTELTEPHYLSSETLEVDRAPIVGTAIAKCDFN